MGPYWIWLCLAAFILVFFYALIGLWKSRFQLSISYVPEEVKGKTLSSFERLQKELAIRWPYQKVYMTYQKGIYGCLWTYLPSQMKEGSLVLVIHREALFPIFEKLDQLFQENVPTEKKIRVLLVEENPSQAFVEFGIQDTTIVQTELEFPFAKGLSYQQEAVWDVYFKHEIDVERLKSYFPDCHVQAIEQGIRIRFPRYELYHKARRMLKKMVEKEGFLLESVIERNGFQEKEKGIVSQFQYSLPKNSHFIGAGYRKNEDGYIYMKFIHELLKKGGLL
ncbi:hypothetical protein [Bulleidia sp. zg-1006]|uniref:hypothetical protein n=1 Tax=Bulleidia sp. zg-1006 TaxID=2806552 RepID=UPI00193AA003|nr:hypothetical protein [Bulleidia sp. zg-1006]QRG87449.1 hypothetical protein JOS54_03835 [Bulleidia sp. zg-1006]